MKVLSLFDGISCGMVALERVDIQVDRYIAYEIDEDVIRISQKNYPFIEHCGDVFRGDFTRYKGFDLLLGGSPCTFWSIAKSNREITPDGIGGRLFMEYVRALGESECRYFLYENNSSIHQNIKDFISEQLGVQPITINSSLLSAQSRKRCYWTNIPDVSQPEDKGLCVKDILDYNCTNFIDYTKTHNIFWTKEDISEYYNGMVQIGHINKGSMGGRIYSVYGKSSTINANGGGQGAKTGLYLIDGSVRKLTPLEAERLQTLPDNYTLCEGVSETSRYRGIGNGWTVDVIAHILKNIPKENKTPSVGGLFDMF